MRITVDIPDEFVPSLVPAGRDASRLLLEESVAGAYRDRRLTMEQVRQILGFETRMQVDTFLQQHEIYDYTVEDLKKDIVTLDEVAKRKESIQRFEDMAARLRAEGVTIPILSREKRNRRR